MQQQHCVSMEFVCHISMLHSTKTYLEIWCFESSFDILFFFLFGLAVLRCPVLIWQFEITAVHLKWKQRVLEPESSFGNRESSLDAATNSSSTSFSAIPNSGCSCLPLTERREEKLVNSQKISFLIIEILISHSITTGQAWGLLSLVDLAGLHWQEVNPALEKMWNFVRNKKGCPS